MDKLANLARRVWSAQSYELSIDPYRLAQFGLAAVFGKAISPDFKADMQEINDSVAEQDLNARKLRELGKDVFDIELAKLLRRFVNIFEIRNAVYTATSAQFADAQFIWQTICRSIICFSGATSDRQLGLTTTRQFQATFGALLLGALIVALRTKGEAPLVQLSKLIAAHIDKLEVGRSTGQWANPEDLVGYSDKVEPEFMPTVGVLWKEFCAEIEDRRPLV
jgi:hypothetical protein